MQISQWNITRDNSPISGLHRYDNEIFKECSKYTNVTRCRSTGKIIKTLNGMKQGDVTHITTHQLAFLKTLKHVNNCVVTVHDIIPHNWFSLRRQISDKWILNEFLLSRADMFIADSNYTKYDLLRHFRIPDEKVKVVYLGVDHSVFYPRARTECREMFGMSEDEIYLLSVSSGEPWKNTQILEKLPYKILDIGYGRGQLGLIGDDHLACLYNACDAFLAPSVAEGFGLPVVEAMACGCPVIASHATSFPEVLGNGGLTVDPFERDEWVHAIESVLSSREKWSKRGIERASRCSWEKCGEETVDVYRGMI